MALPGQSFDAEHPDNGPYAYSPWLMGTIWYGVSFSIVAAFGLVNLYYPLGPDQANVFLGAQLMSQGDVLYVDYWDNKQPGLYIFYYVAGTLFGYSEQGIHLLELLWLLVFCVALMWTLRGVFRHQYLSAIVPVASIGLYYAIATEYELTQLEFLVSFPVFLSMWLVARNYEKTGPKAIAFFASGVLAGISVAFKLALAPLFAVMWLVVLIDQVWIHRKLFLDVVIRAWVPVLLGLTMVLVAITFAFWRKGALDSMLWTAFVYPFEAFATSPSASKSRLVTAAAFYGSYYAPWLIFMAIGVVAWWRERQLLLTLTMVWLAVAVALFVVQNFSWWSYHTLLLFTPSGILAVFGVDRTVDYLSRSAPLGSRRRAAIAALVSIPLVASMTGPFVSKARPLLHEVLITRKGIHEYQFHVSESYARLWRGTRFLRNEAEHDADIYVFGHPFAYVFAGRGLSHSTTGTSWEFFSSSQVRDLLDHLERRRIAYILVGKFDKKLFRLRPEIATYLNSRYEVFRDDGSGTWYKRRHE